VTLRTDKQLTSAGTRSCSVSGKEFIRPLQMLDSSASRAAGERTGMSTKGCQAGAGSVRQAPAALHGHRQDSRKLRVRRGRQSDVARLVCLENECFGGWYAEHRFSESDFCAYLRNRRSILLVAIGQSCLVGYVAGAVRTSRSESSARIESIAALPAYRQQGVGGRLVRRFVHEATGQGCRAVTLEVAVVNGDAIRFFSRRGFRRTRRLPSYYGHGMDGVRMKLDLRPSGGGA